MRLRLGVLACLVTPLATVALGGPAQGAPRHNQGLTIAATPNPVISGEGVLIYGRLKGAGGAGQTIRLYHHLLGSGRGYTLVGTTTTDQAGYYEFTRAEGVVDTNRNWFVRGPAGSHSLTVHERVMPLVSVTASTTSTDTNHPIVFAGSVAPAHRFERVFLQQEIGSTDDWRTLTSTFTDGSSHYALAHRWRRPGTHDVRIVIRRDVRNTWGASDPVTVEIQQAQFAGFTIGSSEPIAPAGSTVTISGVLDHPGSPTPEPNMLIQLWGHAPGQRFTVLADGTTGSDGAYQFTEPNLTTNMIYQIRTMRAPGIPARHTALLYQGVQDVVTLAPSATSASSGQPVTFSGTVVPDKAGHVIYLQKQGADGDWHTIAVGFVRHDSTYQFVRRLGSPGTFNFRTRITSDGINVGGHSDPATVTVTIPPASSVRPGS